MKPSISEQTSKLGRFVDHINTKKGGPFSPVKRSHRINPYHEAVGKCKMECERTEAVRFISPINLGTNLSFATKPCNTPAAVKTKDEVDDIQDLCSFFHSTLKVDDSTLKVEASNIKRTSPMPKEGRFTTIMPKSATTNDDSLFLIVKRSLRKNTGEH